MSTKDSKSIEEIQEEVKNEVAEYENQREVCLSFREYFSKMDGIKVWAEPVLKLPDGKFKTPDLLLAKNEWVILDYKEITSRAKTTLNSHLSDVAQYRQQFTLGKVNFEPDIGLICPLNIAPAFKELVNTAPVLGCRLGKNIRLRRVAGDFRSHEISNLFPSETSFPLATQLSMQKFLRHDPKAIAYTAEIVRTVLWQLNQTLGSDDIVATRKQLIDAMTTLYPPYLLSHKGDGFDIYQVTSGRVNQALEFLDKIDFVTIKKAPRERENEDVISTSRRKAPQVTNFIEYFIKKEAELRFEALEKARKKEEREQQRKLAKEEKKRQKDALKTAGTQTLDKWIDKNKK